MQLTWTYSYQNEGFWEPDHKGAFLLLDEPFFFYRKQAALSFFSFSEARVGKTVTPANNGKTNLPSTWLISNTPHKQIVCSEESSFNLESFCWERPDQEKQHQYLQQEELMRQKYVTGDYHLGEYVIKHDGSYGFKCYLNGKEQWALSCQGYLYTDMELYDGNRILFGTDGRGGRFYEVDLASGRIVIEINTKGTNHYAGEGDIRYLLLLGKPGRVLSVNLRTGMIEDSVVLPGTVTKDNRIWKNENYIFATSFVYKSGRANAAQLNCIEL